MDITPWDKNGHSAFGLKRNESKWIATAMIILAIAMMIPPVIPDPSDLLNLFLANKLSLLGFSKSTALLLTYTLIPWTLFYIGLWFYPYNTRSLFNSYVNKLKKQINRIKKNPVILGIGIIVVYIIFNWYSTII